MKTKPIKLSPKKSGSGYITSYTINIGSAEARQCGFVNQSGSPSPIEKIVDPDNNQIVIKLKQD
jgi:hypothetical protein